MSLNICLLLHIERGLMDTQRLEAIEKRYYALEQKVERLDQNEKKHDFTIRDSSVKIGIAQGLAESTHKKMSELELAINALKADMKEQRDTTSQDFESIHKKLDMQGGMLREQGDMLRQLLNRIPE